MDPLWSETCWSTFKYFINLIVSTYYILCISWIIKCLKDQTLCLSLILIYINPLFLLPPVLIRFSLSDSLPGVILTYLWNVPIGSPTATGHFPPSLYLEYSFLYLLYVYCPVEKGTHSSVTPVAVYKNTGCHNLLDRNCTIIAMRS